MSQLNGNNDLHSKNIPELLILIEKENCATKRVRAMEVVVEKMSHNSMDVKLDGVDFIISISRLIMDSILDENIDIMSRFDDNCDDFTKDKLKHQLLLGARVLTVIKSLLDLLVYRKHIQIAEISSLPNNVLNVVNKTFSHCKLSKDSYQSHLNSLEDLLDLFRHAQEIHKKFFLILQANIKFNLIINEEKKILLDVIDVVYDIILATMGMNTKLMVETWKAFTNIISQNAQGLKFDLNIGKPLKIISNECLKTLKEIDLTLTNENSIHDYLKINKFYMKIAKHIFSAYWEQSKQSQVDTLDFFVTLYSFSTPYTQPKTASNNLLKIIEGVYYNFLDEYLLRFVREVDIVQIDDLFNGLDNSNNFGVIILVLKLIEYSESLKDFTLLLYLNGVLQSLNSDLSFFSMDLQIYGQNLYEYLLLTFANKIMNVNSSEYQQIEELFTQHLFQGSASQSIFVHDLWILILRKSPDLSCDLIQQFVELSQLHHCKQSLLDRTLESTKMKYFMRSVYNNLPEKNREFLFEKYLPEESIAIWGILGFESVPQRKVSFAESTIQCVHKKINKLDQGIFDIEEFIYVINGLSIISSTITEIEKHRPKDFSQHVNYVMKLWNVDFSKDDAGVLTGVLFTNFISELCTLTGKLLGQFDGTQLAHITKQLTNLTKISPAFKTQALEISLALCESNNPIRNLISFELARGFLEDPSALVRESGFEILKSLLRKDGGGNRGGGITKGASWLRDTLNEIRDRILGTNLNPEPGVLNDLREFQGVLNQILN